MHINYTIICAQFRNNFGVLDHNSYPQYSMFFRRSRIMASLFHYKKHAYSNILKILPPKTESFEIKNLIFFKFLSRLGGSNEYPQSMIWAEICKISEFLSENFQFLEVKFSINLNRRDFIMGIKQVYETNTKLLLSAIFSEHHSSLSECFMLKSSLGING